MPLGVFETYTGVTTLFGELEGTPVSFSSLTWPDWQVESYDCASTPQTATLVPGGLLDRWLADLGTAYGIAPASPQALAELAGAMICGDFLQRFSDPNIAYVNDGDPGNGGAVPVIGLAGTDDLCSIMAPILTNAGITPPAPFPTWASFCAVPVGTPPTGRPAFQISELVKLEGGGLSTILYSFSAIDSGQSELQSPTSHTGIYEITAPFIPPGPPTPVPAIQPFGLALLSFGLMLAAGWARRRRR